MRAAIPTLSNGTDTFLCYGGVGELFNTGSEPTGGVYFRQDASANWKCITRNASTETSTDSGIPIVAGTFYDLELIINAAGTSVQFFINRVLIATNTTNIPSTLTYNFRGCRKTAGTTPRIMYGCTSILQYVPT
jgi:SO2946-like, C-terminal domain